MKASLWHAVSEAAALVAVVAVAALIASGACGCGSPLRTHATAATITGGIITAGGDAIVAARAAELDACPDTACTDAGEAHWSPWVASYRLIAEAWSAWEAAIVVGLSGIEPEEHALELALQAAGHLVALWNALAEVLRSAGVTVPALPSELLALLGAT